MKLSHAFAAASALVLLPGVPAAAEPPPATKRPVDGLVSSPANFKLLLESEHVRVLQYTLLPGAPYQCRSTPDAWPNLFFKSALIDAPPKWASTLE